MEKVLVTGANGYIGRHVVDTLLKCGYEVVATDRSTDGINKEATIIQCDLFNVENPYEFFGHPDRIIHLAWVDGFNHKSYNHILFLPLHFKLIESLVSSGLKHVTVMGSMHEVGFFEGCIDEHTPTNPLSLYGIAKNTLRQSLEVLKQSFDFSLTWIRGFYITGDDTKNHSIFASILQKANDGCKTFPFTLGLNKYDFIHIDDLALAIAIIGTQNKVSGIVNACSGKPVMLKDAVEKFISDHNLDIKPEYGVFPTRPYDSKIIYGDVTRLKMILDDCNLPEAKELLRKLA